MISSLLFSFLLFSMSDHQVEEDGILSEFTVITKGNTEKVNFPKHEILNPIMMTCTDRIIALSNVFKPTHLSVYDYRASSFMGHFLNAGRGNGEVSIMTTLKTQGEELYFWDLNKRQLSTVRTNNPGHIINSVSFVKANEQIFKVYRINDDMSLGTGPFKGYPFAIMDNKADSITTLFGIYPLAEDDNLNDTQKAYACQWNCHYEPERKKMVAATTCGSFIAFYELKDLNKPALVCKKGNILPKFAKAKGGSVKFLPHNTYGFIDVAGNAHYCVALYWGKRYDDYPQDIFGGNMLLIYDWNGNPIKAIKLNSIYRAITVTPDSDTILLVRKNERTGEFMVEKLCLLTSHQVQRYN